MRKEQVGVLDGWVVEDFFRVEMRSFALIVLVMEDGMVLMLRQYKHGSRCASLTFPAGHVEDGEESLVAARRGLLEATGCEARAWQGLGAFVDHGNQFA